MTNPTHKRFRGYANASATATVQAENGGEAWDKLNDLMRSEQATIEIDGVEVSVEIDKVLCGEDVQQVAEKKWAVGNLERRDCRDGSTRYDLSFIGPDGEIVQSESWFYEGEILGVTWPQANLPPSLASELREWVEHIIRQAECYDWAWPLFKTMASQGEEFRKTAEDLTRYEAQKACVDNVVDDREVHADIPDDLSREQVYSVVRGMLEGESY